MNLNKFKPPFYKKLVYRKIEHAKAADDRMILVVTLLHPIAEVVGSQPIDIDGELLPLKSIGVRVVKILEDNADTARIYPDRKVIKYPANYVLDVSRSGDVWLTAKSFRLIAQEYRLSKRLPKNFIK